MCRLAEALPNDFEGVLVAAGQAASTKPDGDMAQWQLHQDIIQEQFAQLLGRFATDQSDQVFIAIALGMICCVMFSK